jgi:hypothetical protein
VLPDIDEPGGGQGSVLALRLALWGSKAVAKFAIFALGVLIAAEVSCRWMEQASGRELFIPPLRPARKAVLPAVLPPGARWSQAGVDYSLNEWGLRGGKVDLIRPSGTVRVLVLGGTTAFGEGLPAEKTVAGQLDALLNGRSGRREYEVLNGGGWGYSPSEQWSFYEEELLQLKPDVVVWLLEGRPGDVPSTAGLKKIAEDSWLSSSLFKGSHFARLLAHRQLAEGASTRKTDFLALVEPADKFVRQSEARFLYAVFPAREMERAEWDELPGRGRLDVPALIREDYLLRTPGSQRAVAEIVQSVLEPPKKN